mgnify:CR=1 FL=1
MAEDKTPAEGLNAEDAALEEALAARERHLADEELDRRLRDEGVEQQVRRASPRAVDAREVDARVPCVEESKMRPDDSGLRCRERRQLRCGEQRGERGEGGYGSTGKR